MILFCRLAESKGFSRVVRELENVCHSSFERMDERSQKWLGEEPCRFPESKPRSLIHLNFVLICNQFPAWRVQIELVVCLWLIALFESLDSKDEPRCSPQSEELDSHILGEDLGFYQSLWNDLGYEY